MTLHGIIQEGKVVFENGQPFPDGTHVAVSPIPVSAENGDPSSIWSKLAALGRKVESLPCDLPQDLAENHDHYLHGAPKRS